MMARLECDHFFAAGLLLRCAGGLRHFKVVGTHELAQATHGGDLAHLGHGRQAAGEFANDFFFVAAQLVDVDGGRAEVHTEVGHVATSSITAATCSKALEGMQPTFRHTPPKVA